ncbi:MAG: protease complex subunit PrcB family protein [Planctomycetota bacterium]
MLDVRNELGQQAFVFLIAGTDPGDIALPDGARIQVNPNLIVPLGVLDESLQLPLPGATDVPVLIQVLAVTLPDMQLRASNAIELGSEGRGAPDRYQFVAALISTDSLPPYWSLHVALTVNTGGYELVLDRLERLAKLTRVYFRLIAPGSGEIVTQAQERLKHSVELGSDVSERVSVMLAETDETPTPSPSIANGHRSQSAENDQWPVSRVAARQGSSRSRSGTRSTDCWQQRREGTGGPLRAARFLSAPDTRASTIEIQSTPASWMSREPVRPDSCFSS